MFQQDMLRVMMIFHSWKHEPIVSAIQHSNASSVYIFSSTKFLNQDFLLSLHVPITLNTATSTTPPANSIVLGLAETLAEIQAFISRKDVTPTIPWILWTEDQIDTQDVFKLCWTKGQTKVIVIANTEACHLVYKYNPFPVTGKCFDTSPVKIDEWCPESGFRQGGRFFDYKITNLRKCPARVIMFQYPPYSYTKKDKKGKLIAVGKMIMFLRVVELMMNFTPVYIDTGDFDKAVNTTGDSPTDMAYAMPSYVPNFERGNLLYWRCISYCVPLQFMEKTMGQVLLSEFNPKLWYAIGGVYVFASLGLQTFLKLVSDLTGKDVMKRQCLTIFSTMLGFSYRIPKLISTRFFISGLLVFSIVIGTLYQTRLQGIRTIPKVLSRIKDVKAIRKQGFKIYTPRLAKDFIKENYVPLEYAPKIIHWNSFAPNASSVMIKALSQGDSVASIGTEYCKFVAKSLGKSDEGFYRTYFLGCGEATMVYMFGFPLGSPIRERVFNLTSRLWESGISVYVTTTKQDKEILAPSHSAINLETSALFFYLLFYGIASGCVAFIGEFLYSYFTSSRLEMRFIELVTHKHDGITKRQSGAVREDSV